MSGARRTVTTRSNLVLALIQALARFAMAAAQPLQPAFALEAVSKPDPSLTVPLPPVRPVLPDAGRTKAETPPAAAAPAAPPEAPAPPKDLAREPRSLPPAPRARMHACGLEWQKLKETGAAAEKTWFDFAQICLTK
jgi:hypothetical protein